MLVLDAEVASLRRGAGVGDRKTGEPHWILSRTNRLTIHAYQAITSKIKGQFSPVLLGTVP